MWRPDDDLPGGEDGVLVFIAGRTSEAQRAEAALVVAGIHYWLEAEEFTQGILSSMRRGVGFYVSEADAAAARRELADAQLQSGIIDA